MRKVFLYILVLALLTGLLGCKPDIPADTQTVPPQETEPEILYYVPELTVSGAGEDFNISSGNYSWSAPGENGEMSAVIACGAHPLDRFHKKDFRVMEGDTVRLSFPVAPDRISVRCWPKSAIGNVTQREQEVTLEGMSFALAPGDWVYEVTAVWEKDTWNGEASYYLYLSKA